MRRLAGLFFKRKYLPRSYIFCQSFIPSRVGNVTMQKTSFYKIRATKKSVFRHFDALFLPNFLFVFSSQLFLLQAVDNFCNRGMIFESKGGCCCFSTTSLRYHLERIRRRVRKNLRYFHVDFVY